ncbi:hypothetical protein [Sulfurimonas sp. HSL3-2]|uniref:hypothetical protein n=1 Tax=Hydrocurvibacter mobilis TaxID=3131936 RepID=UPI0031FA3DC0
MEANQIINNDHNINLKTRKVRMKKLILSVGGIILIILAIHFNFYFALKEKFHAKESINPQATAYFVQATTISTIWIKAFHKYLGIPYDSVFFRPLISLRDYFFAKGEEAIEPDNAEDAMWWVQNYMDFYGFTVSEAESSPYKIEKLDLKTRQQIAKKLYNYIIKFDNGSIKGVYAKEYGDNFITLSNFIGAYLRVIPNIYEGQTKQEKSENFYCDITLTKKLIQVDYIYTKALEESSLDINQKYYYLYYRYDALESIIFGTMYRSHGFPIILCKTTFMQDYINVFRELSHWVIDDSIPKDSADKDHTRLFRHIALSNNPKKVSTYTLVAVDKYCPQYDVKDLLKFKERK